VLNPSLDAGPGIESNIARHCSGAYRSSGKVLYHSFTSGLFSASGFSVHFLRSSVHINLFVGLDWSCRLKEPLNFEYVTKGPEHKSVARSLSTPSDTPATPVPGMELRQW